MCGSNFDQAIGYSDKLCVVSHKTSRLILEQYLDYPTSASSIILCNLSTIRPSVDLVWVIDSVGK